MQLLWLGSGVPTLVMVAIGIIATLRLRSVASSFEKQTNVAGPRSAAARQLEFNVLDYALAAHQYLRRRISIEPSSKPLINRYLDKTCSAPTHRTFDFHCINSASEK